ncbi:hypothetical protein BS17DRAFT_769400 [Gyrodon lividus]|nr:hypothetical protein BS17DRAFT_769400 [Gyrodon lividus]
MAHQTSTPEGSSDNARWMPVEVTALVDYLYEHCAECGDSSKFKEATYNAAAVYIKNHFNGVGAVKTGEMDGWVQLGYMWMWQMSEINMLNESVSNRKCTHGNFDLFQCVLLQQWTSGPYFNTNVFSYVSTTWLGNFITYTSLTKKACICHDRGSGMADADIAKKYSVHCTTIKHIFKRYAKSEDFHCITQKPGWQCLFTAHNTRYAVHALAHGDAHVVLPQLSSAQSG